MNTYIYEAAGWYGTVAIVLAYTLNSLGVVGSTSVRCLLLNLTGAMGIVAIPVKKGARQPAVLNVIWSIVALMAVVKILFFTSL